jgi:hypothetical protein
MAKKYFQGDSGFKVLVGKNAALKTVLPKLKDYKMYLYLETDDGTLTGIPRLKLISEDIKVFQSIYKILSSEKTLKSTLEKPNNQALFEASSFKFRLYKSGGRLTNVIDNDGNMVGNKTPSPQQGEDGTRYCLEFGSKAFPSKEAINKAVGFEFDKSWHSNFEKTYNAILTVIPKAQLSSYDFYRDSNKKKLDVLNKITDESILPDSKDNWNPADIWAVKKTTSAKLQTEGSVLYTKLKEKKLGIEDLNKWVETKFKSKDLIGISLKKVDGPKGNIVLVKVDSSLDKNIVYESVSEKFKYNTLNSYVDFLLKIKVYKDTTLYRFRFRPRAASGQLKTYGEGQAQDAKTFDGAISSDLVNTLFPKIQGWIKYCETDLKTMKTVYDTCVSQTLDKDFAKFIQANKYTLVQVEGMDEKIADPYKIRRACVLLYYIWHMEKVDKKKAFKEMYMAAKKMNSFSSIHYKVYG